ncbi:CCT domain [Sesbania bispinosa]|nr:CCT domain [Sesbania bispinosa]
MAFTHQLCSNNTFPIDLTAEFSTAGVAAVSGNTSVMDNTMWGHQDPVLDNGALDHIVQFQDWDTTMSNQPWMSTSSSPENLAISECKMGFYDGTAGFQNFNGSNTATQNWVIQDQMPASEEHNIKIERYSEEERRERILRYLKKRNQRNFNKTIKYACRKTLADRRVRVRGRFARNNNIELSSEEVMARKNNEINSSHKEDFYGHDSIQFQFQLKNDDDDWLQEAMTSLVYLSHSSPDDDI